MSDYAGFLITWTTYGTWLPGDVRGWRERSQGVQPARPQLESWCRDRLAHDAVVLRTGDRDTVEDACREHCRFRGWELLAVNARSNHVHVVIAASVSPQTVRDQLKANCTRRLRTQTEPLVVERTWSRGGDCQVLPNEEALADAVAYVLEGQDRQH
ncbi:transposase [Botrimarina colliarenosi]|uniref:transposase n=1 Tax=Botrimarina colliarenosi TaxID=2528001 RepID=UPI0011B63C75